MCLRETIVYHCSHSDRRPDLVRCPMAIESNLTRCPMLESRTLNIPISCRECLDRGARQGDEAGLQATLNASRNEYLGRQMAMGTEGDEVIDRLRGLSLNEFQQQAEAQLQRDIQATMQASANEFEAQQIAMGVQDIERLRGLGLRDFEAQAEAQMMRDIEATKQASISELEAKGYVFGEELWQDRGTGYDEAADRKLQDDINKAMKASILDAVSGPAEIDDGGAVSMARPMGSTAYGEGGSSRAPQAQAQAQGAANGRKGSIAAGKAPATGKAGPSLGKPGPQYGKPGPTFGNANTTIHRPSLGNSDDAGEDEEEQLRPPVEWMVDPRDAATGKFFGPPVWTAPAPEVDPFEEQHGAGQTLGGAASRKLDPRAAARERWNRVARTLPRVKPEPPPKPPQTMEDWKKSARNVEAQKVPSKHLVLQNNPAQPMPQPKIEGSKKTDPRNTSAIQPNTATTRQPDVTTRQGHRSSRSQQPLLDWSSQGLGRHGLPPAQGRWPGNAYHPPMGHGMPSRRPSTQQPRQNDRQPSTGHAAQPSQRADRHSKQHALTKQQNTDQQSLRSQHQSATQSKPTPQNHGQSQGQTQPSLASLWLKNQAGGGKPQQTKPQQEGQRRQAAPSTPPIWDRRAAAKPQPVSTPGSVKPHFAGSESQQAVSGKIGTYQPQTKNLWQSAGAPPTRPQPAHVQTVQAEEEGEEDESDNEVDMSPEAMRARRMKWLENMKKGKPQDE